MKVRLLGSVCGFVVVLAGLALAEIPQMISYQGMVTDGAGNPAPDSNYPMRFMLYDVDAGGTPASTS